MDTPENGKVVYVPTSLREALEQREYGDAGEEVWEAVRKLLAQGFGLIVSAGTLTLSDNNPITITRFKDGLPQR